LRLEEKISSLELTNKQLFKQYQYEITKATREIEKHKQKESSLAAEFQQAQEKIVFLSTQLKQDDDKISLLTTDINVTSEKFSLLSRNFERLSLEQTSRDLLEKELSSSHNKCLKLEEELHNFQAELQRFRTDQSDLNRLRDLEKAYNYLQAQWKILQQKSESDQDSLAERLTTIQRQNEEYEQLKSLNTNLTNTCQELRSKVVELEAKENNNPIGVVPTTPARKPKSVDPTTPAKTMTPKISHSTPHSTPKPTPGKKSFTRKTDNLDDLTVPELKDILAKRGEKLPVTTQRKQFYVDLLQKSYLNE